jgi:hypothetical protein
LFFSTWRWNPSVASPRYLMYIYIAGGMRVECPHLVDRLVDRWEYDLSIFQWIQDGTDRIDQFINNYCRSYQPKKIASSLLIRPGKRVCQPAMDRVNWIHPARCALILCHQAGNHSTALHCMLDAGCWVEQEQGESWFGIRMLSLRKIKAMTAYTYLLLNILYIYNVLLYDYANMSR